MAKQEEIKKAVDFLFNELSSVYCYNCRGNLDDDFCGDCHRKYMNWGIDEDTATSIVNEITKIPLSFLHYLLSLIYLLIISFTVHNCPAIRTRNPLSVRNISCI